VRFPNRAAPRTRHETRKDRFPGTVAVLRQLQDFFYHTALLALGSALCAFAVRGILVPQGFLSRGLTGAALLLYFQYPILSVERSTSC